MSLDVIGVGLPRTGTESLKQALEILGFGPCYHMVEIVAHPDHISAWQDAGPATDWNEVFRHYRAAVDFPAMFHWQRLIEYFPQAQVILSVREAAAWFASISATVLTAVKTIPADDAVIARRRRLVQRDLVDGLFAGRADDRDFMLECFARHQAQVIGTVAAERLLVFDVREGWQPLCRFLAVDVPTTPFPHVNARAAFQQRFLG